MADIRLVNALSKEFPLPVELEADDVEDVESSEIRELVLCKLEMSMNGTPFRIDFSEKTNYRRQRFSEIYTGTAIQCDLSTSGVTGG
jgi:hypothetical protein